MELTIGSVPDDVLVDIFCYLNDTHRAAICSVSSRWEKVSLATGVHLRPQLAKYYALVPHAINVS